MKHAFVPVSVLALALGAAAHAQDRTVTSKTQVKGDDASTMVVTGCLTRDATGTLMLTGASGVAGGDLTAKSRTTTDVDDHDTKVKTKSQAKVEDEHHVGTSGAVSSYLVTPRAGVDLNTHVGERVEIAAVKIDARTGHDDDAKVKIQDKTKVDRDDAPDAKSKSTTKLELPRGAYPTLTAVSVKSVSPTCQ